MKKVLVMMLAVVMLISACATPTAAPTEAPAVVEPTEAPAEEPAAEPTEAPAAEPTEDPAAVAAEFYAGMTVTLYTTSAAGSSSDLFARTLAKYLAEPTGAEFVVVNENAGGGKVIMNQVYNTIEADGLSMVWSVTGSFFPPFLQGDEGVEYDIGDLQYLGGTIKGNTLLGMAASGDIQTAEDFMNATEPLTFSTTRPNTAPTMANALAVELLAPAGSSIISGFEGSTGKLLAVQQGDVNGTVSSADSILKAETDGVVTAILQIGLTRTPPADNLPALGELVDEGSLDDFQKKLLATIDILYDVNIAFMAPGVPTERADFMAAALKTVLDDPAFVAELEQVLGSELLPYVSGEEVSAVAENLIANQSDIPAWTELLEKVVK